MCRHMCFRALVTFRHKFDVGSWQHHNLIFPGAPVGQNEERNWIPHSKTPPFPHVGEHTCTQLNAICNGLRSHLLLFQMLFVATRDLCPKNTKIKPLLTTCNCDGWEVWWKTAGKSVAIFCNQKLLMKTFSFVIFYFIFFAWAYSAVRTEAASGAK